MDGTRPDWRNAKAYPSEEERNTNLWAWEFLRRNHDYISDFAYYLAKLPPDCFSYTEALCASGDGHVPFGMEWCVNGVPCVGKTVKDLPRGASLEPTAKVIGDSYGLAYEGSVPPNPALAYQDLPSPPTFDFPLLILPPGTDHHHAIGKHEVGLLFKLDLPLDRQLERAQRFLKTYRQHFLRKSGAGKPRNPRLIFSMYRDYLRILDAYDAGHGYPEIAAELLPHEDDGYPDYRARKKIAKQHEVAERLRSYGYLKIAARLSRFANKKGC